MGGANRAVVSRGKGAGEVGSLWITTLGQVGLRRDGVGLELQPAQRQLLALLVATGPDGAAIDRLADEIWADELPSQWRASIRVAVSRLRKRSGLKIPSKNGRYHLDATADEVDLWKLRRLIDNDVELDEASLPLVYAAEAFSSIELTPVLQSTAAEVATLQRALIERLARSGEPQSPAVLVGLARHLQIDPYDEDLTVAVATIHANSGASSDALRFIDHHRALCENENLGPTASLDDLSETIRAQRDHPPDEAVEDGPALSGVPEELARRRLPLFVGRTDEVAAVCAAVHEPSSRVVVIRGQAGSGKTSLLAEVAERMASGADVHTVFAAGSPGGRIGLAAMTTAVSDFAADVAVVDTLGLDPAGRLGSLAIRLRKRLAGIARTGRVLLLVDDAQWLDSASCELIDFLARAPDEPSTTIVLAARSTVRGKTPWSALQTALDRLQTVRSLDLGPLEVEDVGRLVDRRRPDDPFNTRSQSTRWIHAASGGLPLVVNALLAMADGEAAPVGSSDAVFDRLIEACTELEREVGAAGAVLGHRFRLDQLETLVERSRSETFEALDGLVEQELLVETGSLDEFEFSHQLIMDAFTRSVTRSRRARLHRKASETAADVHALARHQRGALDLVTVETVVDSTIASAQAHLRDGSYWESSAQFRAAIGLDPGLVGEEAFVDMARSLSLSGAASASRRIRARAFDMSVAAKNWAAAHDAAVAGLPEAEVADGELDRLEQLEAIPTRHLDRRRQTEQALHASRIASQLGKAETAKYWAESANALARSDDERGLAAVAEHFVLMLDHPPGLRLERLDAAVEGLDLDGTLACRVEQFRAIDQLELGNVAAASTALDAQRAHATDTNDHLRQWHGLILESQLAELDGRWDEADGLADEALALGRSYGIGQADIVRLAQQYFRQRILGRLGELADAIDLVPEPDSDSMLFRSARATVLAAAGREDDGLALATSIAETALSRPSATSLQCLAIVAEVLDSTESNALRAAILEAFEPFLGNGLVIGVGLGFVASVDVAVGCLGAATDTDRAALLKVAIKEADAAGYLSWAVRYRLDLAAMTGAVEPASEAERLAAGTPLTAMLPAG